MPPKIILSLLRPQRTTLASQIYLHRSFNAMNNPKEHSDCKKGYSNPESIPPQAVPPIVPPLGQSRGAGVIEHLFQNHQPIVPVVEVAKSELVSLYGIASHQLWIDFRKAFQPPRSLIIV
jgi:hypothetical protein